MINKDTQLFGSFSNNPGNNGCIFFNEAFNKYGINAIYKSFYANDPKLIVQSTKFLNFSGFAISAPLKVSILKYLDEIDISAQEIGAVNTVLNKDGLLIGYNTDWLGVKDYFTSQKIKGSINIIGNGGFSRAIQYTCSKMDISYTIITRNELPYIYETEGEIFFNATPSEIKIIKNQLIDGRPFTETGKIIANYQAKHQFEIYTGFKYE